MAQTQMWHDEGLNLVLDVAFPGGVSMPANCYLGLDARVALADTDTTADIDGEPAGDGYARQAIVNATDWTLQQDPGTGKWEVLSAEVTFSADGGDWPEVTNMFLMCTVGSATEVLIASAKLTAPRTIHDGESLPCRIKLRPRELVGT